MNKEITLGSGEKIKFWYNKRDKHIRLSKKDTALVIRKFSCERIIQNLVFTALYNFNRENKQMFVYIPKNVYSKNKIKSYNRHIVGLSKDDTIYININ